jgi:NADPH:quinone reductase-like Zn-dependent oxidoreductase
MQAFALDRTGGLDGLRRQEVPTPRPPGQGEVLIRIRAAALNHLDLFVAHGMPGLEYCFPHVMGADGAGVVEAVGPGVARARPGDRVMINPGISCSACARCLAGEHPLCAGFKLIGEHLPGTLAEFIVVPETNVAPVPDGMPWPIAAAFSLVTLTAWRMLVTRARLRAGETVLIWGVGGGVSQAALRIAKLHGARVVVTGSSPEKLAFGRELGAELALDHGADDVPAAVHGFTERRGADVVVDSVGTATWDRSLRCLARGGRLVTCGATTGPAAQLDIRRLFWHQWNILGSTMGSHEEYRQIAALAARGLLWPAVDLVVRFAEARRAFERLAAGAHLGKIVIEVET